MNQEIQAIPASMLKLFDELPQFLSVRDNDNILSNLKPGPNMLGISSDGQGIEEWLKRHEHSPKTHRSYTLEARRIYLWARYDCGKSLSSLSHTDMTHYWQHLLNPTDKWLGIRTSFLLNGNVNPAWRPFVDKLSLQSTQRSFRVLNSLFNFLVKGRYLEANPVSLMNHGHRGVMGDSDQVVSNTIDHALSRLEWACVTDTIEAMPYETSSHKLAYERLRFIVIAFYTLGARIGELESHVMGDFRQVNQKWRWYLKGKGGKKANIAVSDDLVQAMKQYRTFLGHSAMPAPGDTVPFFLSLSGKRPITARAIYNLIKSLFVKSSKLFTEQYPEKPNKLDQATPHWIRHTTATHLSDNTNDLRIVQGLMRHTDINTTMLYAHVDIDMQYELVNTLEKTARSNKSDR